MPYLSHLNESRGLGGVDIGADGETDASEQQISRSTGARAPPDDRHQIFITGGINGWWARVRVGDVIDRLNLGSPLHLVTRFLTRVWFLCLGISFLTFSDPSAAKFIVTRLRMETLGTSFLEKVRVASSIIVTSEMREKGAGQGGLVLQEHNNFCSLPSNE